MQEYIASLEKEFSGIEHGFKEEQSRALRDANAKDVASLKNLHFLPINRASIRSACMVCSCSVTYQAMKVF